MSTALGTATNTVQVAAVAKLKADTQYMSMITGLFDLAAVPVSQPFPYGALGQPVETPRDSLGTVNARGYETIVTLHFWSQALGFKVLQTIAGRCTAVLTDRQRLTLPGQWHVGTWPLGFNAMEDPDGITQHGVARYLFRVREDL